MSRFRLIAALTSVAVCAWLGHNDFAACYVNGGWIISCGAVGFFLGGLKLGFLILGWIFGILLNGFAHL
jgi:hypothetical protein